MTAIAIRYFGEYSSPTKQPTEKKWYENKPVPSMKLIIVYQCKVKWMGFPFAIVLFFVSGLHVFLFRPTFSSFICSIKCIEVDLKMEQNNNKWTMCTTHCVAMCDYVPIDDLFSIEKLVTKRPTNWVNWSV